MTGALPHLWQRLRRRLALAMLRSRQHQLRDSITRIEQGVEADRLVLDTLRLQLRMVNVRLDTARLSEQRQRLARITTGWPRT